jgi:hypothetical protein
MGGVLIEVNSTVGKLSERSLLLNLGGGLSVLYVQIYVSIDLPIINPHMIRVELLRISSSK